MKEDSVYVRGVWVPMGHERINEMLQIKNPKNGSKYKKLLKELKHEKIINFLMGEKGKWSITKKNPMNQLIEAPSQKKLRYGFISLLM